MALIGKTNAEKIWYFLKAAGMNDYGAAATMANINAESALRPDNLQNTYEKKLGMTDAQYVAAVDAGTYTNFVHDAAGFGLCQWTYWSRKQNLLNYAKNAGTSIADMEMQLGFMLQELKAYPSLWNLLKTATTVKTASDAFMCSYERPADQSEAAKTRRANYGLEYFKQFAGTQAPEAEPEKEDAGQTVTYATEELARAKIVTIAKGWLGCKESDGTHKQIIDVYNGHKPLARGYAVKYTDAWCSTYASAVAIKADMTDIIPTECGCEKHIQLFKALGAWQESDAYTPKPADYVFYDWDDNGSGDCTGSADHVGIVCEVNGSKITVIEGNISNKVGYRTITVNGKNIRGYGVPDYAKAKIAGAVTHAKKSNEEIAREVMAGKWGNGDARKKALTAAGYDYAAVQAIVNKLAAGTAAPVKKDVNVVADEVIMGKWGNGDARKEALVAAGYDYAEVQALVNQKVAKQNGKKSNTEIAKEVIRGDWGNGDARKKALTAAGYDYAAIQKIVNKML